MINNIFNYLSEKNNRVAVGLFSLVLAMLFLAYASVPLYNLFCKVTGFGGTPNITQIESEYVLDKTIEVRFDANVSSDLNWDFYPVQKTYNLKILESLKDPKVQKELEPLIKKFVELEKKEDKYRKTALGIILGISGFTFFMLFAIPSIIDVIEKDKFKEDNSWMKKPLKKEFYSEYYENYCKNEDPTKITQPYFKRYYKTYCID